MYILAKRTTGNDETVVTLHGTTYDEPVCEAWQIAGGIAFQIENENVFSTKPLLPLEDPSQGDGD